MRIDVAADPFIVGLRALMAEHGIGAAVICWNCGLDVTAALVAGSQYAAAGLSVFYAMIEVAMDDPEVKDLANAARQAARPENN